MYRSPEERALGTIKLLGLSHGVKPPPVLTKRDFVRRYFAGEFGNASPTWMACNEFLAYGQRIVPATVPVPGKYHLRNRIAGGSTYYDLTWSAAVARWIDTKEQSNWYVSEMAPTEKTILQGEVMRTERGLYLYYSPVVAPMRDALRIRAMEAERLRADAILRQYLCPNSYDWLVELLDRYPGHVVEFSTYSTKWGTLFPIYNTVFWEVRTY